METGTVRDSERGDVDVRQHAGNEQQMRCEKKVVLTVITMKVPVYFIRFAIAIYL